jgi:hypothetical protein
VREKKMRPRPLLATGIILLVAASVVPGSPGAVESVKSQKFKSAVCGCEIRAPETWHMSEASTDTTCDIAITGEPISSPADRFTYGFRVRRSRKYQDLFQVDLKHFEETTFQVATRFAQGFAHAGEIHLHSGERSISGMRSKRYLLDIGLHSDGCLRGWVEIGVSGAEGLLASGLAPCSDKGKNFIEVAPDEHEKTLLDGVASLYAFRTWGREGSQH